MNVVTTGQNMDEAARLAALHRYDVLDTPPEASFDRITRIAESVLKTPYVLISLVDENRQWIKSVRGLDVAEIPRDVSFCAQTIATNFPFIVEDATLDERFRCNPLVAGDAHVRFYAGAPLVTSDGFAIGALCAMDRASRTLSKPKTELLTDLASLVMETLELQRTAATDALTGVLTRRSFHRAAERELERARRFDRQAALIVFDIDHFKSINDTHGHAAGDAVLQALAKLCRPVLRTIDLLARLGGEEFAVMLPETRKNGAVDVAERLRQALANASIEFEGQELQFTSSFGVTVFGVEHDTVEIALDRADDALYRAKNAGRNRVIFAPATASLPSVA